MNLHAFSTVVGETDSKRAADDVGHSIRKAFSAHPLKALLVYATVNHDQAEILRRLRSELGAEVAIVGCSVTGVAVRGDVREGGFLLAAMGLGGSDLRVAAAFERDIQTDTRSKGQRLGRTLVSALGEDPKLTFACWDSLGGADLEQLFGGLNQGGAFPLIGGGAGQPFGPIVRTYQYFDEEVTTHAGVVLGLSGPFSAEIGVSHGTSPTGVAMRLTRAEGTKLIEIDGRPAIDIWREVTGCTDDDVIDQDYFTAWAVGIERKVRGSDGAETPVYLVRMAIGFDPESKALIVPTAIPQGSRIVLHHRTTEAVFDGALSMGRELAARIEGTRPWAALGFECCARTSPFLGESATLQENLELQKIVAPDAPWLGMMAWGEAAPVGDLPAFHNYTYPLAILTA